MPKEETENPELFDKITQGIIEKMLKEETEPETVIENEKLFSLAVNFVSIANKEYRNEIKNALENSDGEPPKLSEKADFLWYFILGALLLAPPQEVIDELAQKLDIDPEKLKSIGQQAQENERTPYLKGLEPPQEERINKLILPPLPAVDYTKGVLKATSKLNRRIGFVMNVQNMPVPLDITSNVPLEKSKRCIYFSLTQFTTPDGKPQTITPYDQEVENTLSNLFEEGNSEVTSQQIYCKMNGITSKGKRITPAAQAEIDNSIRKLNRTYADFYIVETINGEKRERHIKEGHILDTFYKEDRFSASPGKSKAAWISSRPGILFIVEKEQNNRLVTVEPAQLNLLESGIQLTPLSIAIRRFCLDEIFRIAATGSYETARNKFLLERFFTYDRDPALTEIITPPNGVGTIEVKLKTGADATEQSKIRMAKKHRRDLLQDILEHLKRTDALKNWDFIAGDKVLPYTLVNDERNPGREKRQYKTKDIAAADGVLLDVPKTIGASKRIAVTERRKKDNEKASRREKKTK